MTNEIEAGETEQAVVEADLERLASWMDDKYRIPGTNIRFGLDVMIGLIPGIGDLSTAAVSTYILARAWSLGVPFTLKMRMLINILLDLILGVIPLIGDIFDVAWRANRRNVHLLRRHIAKNRAG